MSWTIVENNGGIHLPQIGLHCDARRTVDISFISHAHFDHLGCHRRVICSEGTSRLMRVRLRGKREEIILPFDQPYAFAPDTELRLFPAGHIFGSSQVWMRRDDESVLYTGDFKLRPGRSAEPCATPRADVVIMETTFGLPRYVFPPSEEVLAAIVMFCRETVATGSVPILFGYSLGKSQELLCVLAEAGLPIMLHPQVVKMTAVYESLGMHFPAYKPFDAATVTGHVVMTPPMGRNALWLQEIPNRRTAMVTGWALDSSAKYRYGCDAVFPLSDHADFPDLLRFVELVQPKRVYTVHGFAEEFALTLRLRGIEAWALGRENQLEFGF